MKTQKDITSANKLNKTNAPVKIMANEPDDKSLSSFSTKQKNSIKAIIKDCYANLENLSK